MKRLPLTRPALGRPSERMKTPCRHIPDFEPLAPDGEDGFWLCGECGVPLEPPDDAQARVRALMAGRVDRAVPIEDYGARFRAGALARERPSSAG